MCKRRSQIQKSRRTESHGQRHGSSAKTASGNRKEETAMRAEAAAGRARTAVRSQFEQFGSGTAAIRTSVEINAADGVLPCTSRAGRSGADAGRRRGRGNVNEPRSLSQSEFERAPRHGQRRRLVQRQVGPRSVGLSLRQLIMRSRWRPARHRKRDRTVHKRACGGKPGHADRARSALAGRARAWTAMVCALLARSSTRGIKRWNDSRRAARPHTVRVTARPSARRMLAKPNTKGTGRGAARTATRGGHPRRKRIGNRPGR